MSRFHQFAIAFIAAGMFTGAPVRAETLPPESVRGLVERGDILPLEEVLCRLQPAIEGEIIEVNLDRDGERYLYRIKALGENGRYHEYRADAKTGASAGGQ
jgi:uncharacterized membrane protein YkoI